MALSNETEEFIAGWKKQIVSCANEHDVNVMFEKLRILFQIYNRLYNEISARLKKKQSDQKGATSHVVEYITGDVLVASLEGIGKTKQAELQLRDFVRQHTYHFILVGEQFQPSDADDDALLVDMESANNKVRMEGLLLLIYKVRCNLVHGQKHHSLYQLPLMRCVIPILELVISLAEEKLRT